MASARCVKATRIVKMNTRLLIVEDESSIRMTLEEFLREEGFEVHAAPNGQAAAKLAQQIEFQAALVDLKLPDTDGISLMKKLQRMSERTMIVIMTAYSTVKTAVTALKVGAYDYISKPFDLDELLAVVRRAVEAQKLRSEVESIHLDLQTRYGIQNIVGSSPAVQEVLSLVRKVARSEASTVLLRGESGVGKDLIARAIHTESRRAGRPFMNITCTVLQENLLESELFGHEQGAFTDARTQKQGLFELASGGTVFLDEIGDMTPGVQAKVLRFLEDKTFRRLGGTRDIKADVRVIAATNRNLETDIFDGRFRRDLYYRLNVMPILIPPLRQRLEDLPDLVNRFIGMFNREFKKKVEGITPEALELMRRYDWPGNVRELRNIVERAMLLAAGSEIEPLDLRLPSGLSDAPEFRLPEGGVNLKDIERSLVVQALERTNGNQVAAAKLLGCNRDQVRYFIKKYGLRPRTFA